MLAVDERDEPRHDAAGDDYDSHPGIARVPIERHQQDRDSVSLLVRREHPDSERDQRDADDECALPLSGFVASTFPRPIHAGPTQSLAQLIAAPSAGDVSVLRLLRARTEGPLCPRDFRMWHSTSVLSAC